MKPPPDAIVAFRVPRQLLADLLMAEKAMLEEKTNLNRHEFIHLSRALLSSMELSVAQEVTRGSPPPPPRGV